MRKPPRGLVTALCVIVLVAAAVEVRLPLFVERPLEPMALGEVLEVDGASPAELDASYLVSLIGRRRATTVSAIDALARRDHRLHAEGAVVPAGIDDVTHVRQRRALFARSVDEAAAAALGELGRTVSHRTGGITVVDVVDDSPADGTLAVADVIVSVDGEPMTAPSDLDGVVDGRDTALVLVVERAGQPRRLEVTPAPFETAGEEHVGLGVLTAVAQPRVSLPLDISLDAGPTSGPSAGLLIALAVLDVLDTETDVADGRRIAGTGRITADGRVRSVTGVPTKVRGAVAAGADVFMVPESQRAQAEQAADGRLAVVGVRTLAEAVDELTAGAAAAQPGW